VATAFLVYVLLGPLAWCGLLFLVVLARTRMNRLHIDRSTLPDPAPSLSIVVPARNEAAGIDACVERICQQDYPNARIVVINDRSTDETGARLHAIASRDPRVTPFHVTDLPPGWLGKCHALYVGTQGLSSDWLLFVDSDVTLAPDAARRAVSLCEARDYDALSIMTGLIAPTFWEKTLLPILAMAWGAAFQISLTNDDSRPAHALANGQFFLIRRSIYAQVHGHEAVRDQIVEDVALMRVLKRSGARVRLMMGQQLAQTRMHTNLRQMFNGWARIFAGTSGRRVMPILATMLFLLGTIVLLILGLTMALTVAGGWAIATTIHLMAVLAFSMWMYRAAGQNVLNAFWFPVSWPMALLILGYALRSCWTGRVDWRGNQVQINRHGGKTGSSIN
jgi:cellulose synthase/poly-beta-1,6-N-acetylglucosamine synthase-like glycosyltransferase